MIRILLTVFTASLLLGCSGDNNLTELEECAERNGVECCGDAQCSDGDICNGGTCRAPFPGCAAGEIRFDAQQDSNEPFGGEFSSACVDPLTADECDATDLEGQCACYDAKLEAEMVEGYSTCRSSEAGLQCEDDGAEITGLSCTVSG